MDKYEQELFISPNTKILNSNPENLYRNRLCNTGSISEIYHENSKISKRDERIFNENLKDMINTNIWAYNTFNCTLKEDLKIGQKIVLDPFESENVDFYQKLFEWYDSHYKKIMFMDMFLLREKNIYQIAGNTKKLVLQISNVDMVFLKNNIMSDFELNENKSVIFFVARPWRYMRFIGNRGYRQSLIEIGEVSNSIKKLYRESVFVDYFVDNEINGLLDIDGIENFCVRIMIVG